MTYGADSFGHLGHAHEDCEAASAKGGYGDLVFDVAEFCGGAEDAHVVELGEQLALHACSEGIPGGQEGDPVGVGAQRAAEPVVPGEGEVRGSWEVKRRTCGSRRGPGCGTAA